ncbi:tripartite tricarboxylate transporter substrate binding protein [Leptospira sp. severe_002]|uniref:Bug family tripartite tricarboxylate transporter substrate binding protein n=1 Tax=Leptospira sp. severe_002 TaxID=2838237 RepID=UPI001E31235C|nr:tripartite tricarboxylate transporter substrate-binding protein [Leptospira sp. severe_002]
MPFRKLLAAAATLAALSSSSFAQDWPNRTVTMLIPFAAGGPIDVLGRILQPYLSEQLGQQVIIENVGGGGGMTGSLRVSQAAVDSHMFALASIGTHAISQSMHKKPPYHPVNDFQPVMLVADAPLVLLVRKDLPANNLKEFIAYTKANAGKMQFGSGGTGTSSHIGCVLLNQTIGVDVVHVPYRGGGPALQDLIGGRLDYICNYVSTALSAVNSGQGKVIATLASERAAAFPDVPTADQQGLKNFDISAWNAVFLPKSATPAQVARLNKALSAVQDNPAFRKRLEEQGLIGISPERRWPEYLRKFVADEIEKWAAPVKASGSQTD